MSDPTRTWPPTTYDGPEPQPDVPPRRRVKVGHLVTGLVFLGLAGGWALRTGGALGDVAIGLVIPVVLVTAGIVGLVVSLVGNRRGAAVRLPDPDRTPLPEYAAREYQPAADHDEPTTSTDSGTGTGTDRETDSPTEPTAPITGLGNDKEKQ